MPRIADFDLEIHDVDVIGSGMAVGFADSLCPSITSLNLHFPQFRIGDSAIRFVAAFMKALCTPNLEKLSVSIDFRYADIMDLNLGEEAVNELLCKLLNALLHSNCRHSRLTSLHYKLAYEVRQSHNVTWSVTPLPRTFTIPLDRIPNVSTLTVSTFTRIRFTRGGSFTPCGLQELRLHGCGEIDGGDLQEMIQSFKDAGAWETIKRFEVKDCKALDYETVLEAIGKERLRFVDS